MIVIAQFSSASRVGWSGGWLGKGWVGIASVPWVAPVPCPSGIFYFVVVSPMIML